MTTSQKKTATEVFQNSQKAVNGSSPTASEIKNEEKSFKLSANMYTISYSAFMRSNKEKYRLKTNDQIDIFYRALFMFMIQVTFIYTILFFESFSTSYKNDPILNSCLFFTVLILHWQCLPETRNGIYMMKYALTCPEEFTHPVTVFFIGWFQTTAVWLTEICNLLKSLDQKAPKDVIVRFVGFALILNVPKLMIGSLESFEIQKSVGKLTMKKGRKAAKADSGWSMKLPFGFLWTTIYWVYKRIYTGLYFYFFPFVIIFLPMVQLAVLHANIN